MHGHMSTVLHLKGSQACADIHDPLRMAYNDFGDTLQGNIGIFKPKSCIYMFQSVECSVFNHVQWILAYGSYVHNLFFYHWQTEVVSLWKQFQRK